MRRAFLLWYSLASFVGAVVVFVPGVIWTNGTYGSRMAWLLGVVLPLLLLTAVLAWLAGSRAPKQPSAPGYPASPHGWVENVRSHMPEVPKTGGARKLFIASAALFAIPVALGMALLLVYAALFVRHYMLH
jgi:hypothetical protein